MNGTPHTLRSAGRTAPAVMAAVAVCAAALVACGPDKEGTSAPGAGLARESGCVACHSVTGGSGVGPTWKGLFGSQVTLDDGSVVTVDRDYLVRAIEDPAAQVRMGNKVPMPVNRLDDAAVQSIVDYIISLG